MSCEVTYEELAAFAAGDVEPDRQAEIRAHADACDDCRGRLAALRRSDAALAALPRISPAGGAILAARRAIAELTRAEPQHQIMTLEEAAEFLRISPEQLGEIAEELPAFELAGQIRIRRERLLEWLQKRERLYARHAAASWAAQARSAHAGKGAA